MYTPCRLQSVEIKRKRERMNYGCNRSLNVFQSTPPLYCNDGVCQYKWGAASYSYNSVQYSQIAIFFLTVSTDPIHKIRVQYSAEC
jgi:hypothetical protein